MNLKLIATTLLLTTISLFTPIKNIIAQDPPAETYQPGFWQPVARFSLDSPLEVKLINATPITLDYDITGNERIPTQEIFPGKTATVTDFLLPAYILIYPDNSIPTTKSSEIRLKYEITVDTDNVVTAKIVNVDPIKNPKFVENRSLNLHETGAIYVY